MALLEVEGLAVRYGRLTAVQPLSLAVEAGMALAVLGRNGAGKSSLLRAIAGNVRASEGRIVWQGREITHLSAEARVQAGITLVPEGRRIFPHLTVRENLRLGGFYLSRAGFERAREHVLTLFPILAQRLDQPAGQLSGGQQQMLALGRAIMTNPKLLMLDEPSFGLAPKIVDELYDQLVALREAGIGLLLVEQHAQRALRFASQAIVLNLGQVVIKGSPDALVNNEQLIKTYMAL